MGAAVKSKNKFNMVIPTLDGATRVLASNAPIEIGTSEMLSNLIASKEGLNK